MLNINDLRFMSAHRIAQMFIADGGATVDIEKLAQELNISVLPHNFEGETFYGEKISCAFATKKEGSSCVFYNEEFVNPKDYRAHMILAKAFAKHIITGHKNFCMTEKTELSNTEKNLAHELLMPEEQVRDIVRRLLVPTTYALGEIFQVSQEFVRERLKEIKCSTLIAGYNY